jgi:hypothetical protein
MLIGDLFARDVTRTIPPVVYFHEQSAEALEREVQEYIITGGYDRGEKGGTEDGIHEQLVRLLTGIHEALSAPNAPTLPSAWISGFYGSGKSSFAKLLGLALDGRKLPDGSPLAKALLAQDKSPNAARLVHAWQALASRVTPIAAVFDVGSQAREDEHIHAVVVRQVQARLHYATKSSLVADYELKLELENRYHAFMEKVLAVHKRPWGELKDAPLVEDYFSSALHALMPELYPHEMSWVDARSGTRAGAQSPEEAALAIENMMKQRCPGATLFLVVDEVSQYIHDDEDRMLGLQSFVSALGERLRGKVWILATGQKKLEDDAGVQSPLAKLKDRFPPALRVHLGISNIRDVVHKRLLRKSRVVEEDLVALFRDHRPSIASYAYQGDQIFEPDFVEVYPLLPGYVDLLLDITTGLKSRSTLAQGDAYAIRGLLQLLGDLFREQKLATMEMKRLITLDMVYDVLGSALSPDVQITIGSALALAQKNGDTLMARVVKAVSMLELSQHKRKTSADLVARCLYENVGDGSIEAPVQRALDTLVGENLLRYSEDRGYKIESSAGQEWQQQRDAYLPAPDQESAEIQAEIEKAVSADAAAVQLAGLKLPWLVLYTDTLGAKEIHLKDERKTTVVTLDLQLTRGQGADVWVPRSDTPGYRDRIVWVASDLDAVRHVAKKRVRSQRIIETYGRRALAANDERGALLMEERNRYDAARPELEQAIKAALLGGAIYFRGRQLAPRDFGSTFSQALGGIGNRVATELYPTPTTFTVSLKEVEFLFDNLELAAPPAVFGSEKLGLLALDAGRYEVTCEGRIPKDVLAFVRERGSAFGAEILAHFGGPPHGVPSDVVRASLVGLLRGGKVRVELPDATEVTSARDEGARALLKDGDLRKSRFAENTKETLSPRDRNTICALFKEMRGLEVARDNDAIADAVAKHFAGVRQDLTAVEEKFRHLPRSTTYPEALTKLAAALETCRKDRRVEPTVLTVKRHLPALRDGLALLLRTQAELTDASVRAVEDASAVSTLLWPALERLGATDDVKAAAKALAVHLASARPWEDGGELTAHAERVRSAYRVRRKAILDAHEKAVELGLEALKRTPGFERLGPDERHAVLGALREGADAKTDERSVAPPLEGLATILAARRDEAENHARLKLDAYRAKDGENPVVEVTLGLAGREIGTAGELERALDEVRQRVVVQLEARHRVRLR